LTLKFIGKFACFFHPKRVFQQPANETSASLGGHLNDCRIGFDLGASDYKVAAVKEGEVVYSGEFPWNPKDQADPEYHYERLNSGLKKAAAHLPRVDAIGGSSASVIVDNNIMVPATSFGNGPVNKGRVGMKIGQRDK
jgi:hypothetical protein